jgi:hypothetical protein
MVIVIEKTRFRNNRVKTILTNVPKFFYIQEILSNIKRICKCDAYYYIGKNSITIVLSGDRINGAIKFCELWLHIPYQLKQNTKDEKLTRKIWSKQNN